jgi:hypothetical protein
MADGHCIPARWQVTFGEVQVGTANAAAAHPDPNLSGTGLRLISLNPAERALVNRCAPFHNPGSHVPPADAGR